MPDLEWAAPPPRDELRQGLRARLPALGGSLRVIAEGLRAAEGQIDWVTVDAAGRVVLVLLAEPGRELEAIGAQLAHRAWVEFRLGDWLQLAPGLGLDPAAGVGVVLMAPSFGATPRAAAAALGASAPALWIYRCVRNGAGTGILLEPLDAAAAAAAPEAPPEPSAQPRRAEPALSSVFRTRLTDAQLGLTPEEQREFEGPPSPEG